MVTVVSATRRPMAQRVRPLRTPAAVAPPGAYGAAIGSFVLTRKTPSEQVGQKG